MNGFRPLTYLCPLPLFFPTARRTRCFVAVSGTYTCPSSDFGNSFSHPGPSSGRGQIPAIVPAVGGQYSSGYRSELTGRGSIHFHRLSFQHTGRGSILFHRLSFRTHRSEVNTLPPAIVPTHRSGVNTIPPAIVPNSQVGGQYTSIGYRSELTGRRSIHFHRLSFRTHRSGVNTLPPAIVPNSQIGAIGYRSELTGRGGYRSNSQVGGQYSSAIVPNSQVGGQYTSTGYRSELTGRGSIHFHRLSFQTHRSGVNTFPPGIVPNSQVGGQYISTGYRPEHTGVGVNTFPLARWE
ncbi:unnamed protein product [Acanthosepion pharaonis]|uniref:Uncharacterized protein n=1 Tax=Acanthosepion pharaonis TaxID=158019 RepID=A0A812CBK7_ACAPH|nr:unnamed protein product [Sepia pharaonis]